MNETPIRPRWVNKPNIIGSRAITSVYFSKSELDRLDKLVERQTTARSAVIRQLVGRALDEAGL